MKWYHQQEVYYGQICNRFFKQMDDHVRFSDGGHASVFVPNDTVKEITDPTRIQKLEQELKDNLEKNNDIYERHYKNKRYSGD